MVVRTSTVLWTLAEIWSPQTLRSRPPRWQRLRITHDSSRHSPDTALSCDRGHCSPVYCFRECRSRSSEASQTVLRSQRLVNSIPMDTISAPNQPTASSPPRTPPSLTPISRSPPRSTSISSPRAALRATRDAPPTPTACNSPAHPPHSPRRPNSRSPPRSVRIPSDGPPSPGSLSSLVPPTSLTSPRRASAATSPTSSSTSPRRLATPETELALRPRRAPDSAARPTTLARPRHQAALSIDVAAANRRDKPKVSAPRPGQAVQCAAWAVLRSDVLGLGANTANSRGPYVQSPSPPASYAQTHAALMVGSDC